MVLRAPSTSPMTAFRARAQKRSRRGRIGALAVIALALAGGLVVVTRPTPVTTSEVVRGVAVDAVYATGTIEPVERLTVRARVAGLLGPVAFREGDAVKQGELLARIDSATLHHELARGEADRWAALQQATVDAPQIEALRAQARATEADLAHAKEDLGRTTNLHASGAARDADLEQARTRVARLEAELASKNAQLGSVRIELTARARGSTALAESLAARITEGDVRSPLAGVVLAKYVEAGEVVAPNQPLFRVGSVDELRVECAVDEADIARIVPGKVVAITLYAFGGRVFRGHVVEIAPDADRAKKSFLVRVKLDDPPAGLRSGMSAEVNVVVDEHPGALLVPAESIDAHGEVWVVVGGRAQKRAVEVGIRDVLRVEVIGGLHEGEQVVVAGGDALSPGARVSPTITRLDPNAVPPRPKSGGGTF